MTVMDPEMKTVRSFGAYAASVAIHIGAIAFLFFIAVVTPPKKLETIKVRLLSAAEPEAVPDTPPTVAKPEPPKPEPPKPEPPKPEPPKPEPPKPAPPKPEPVPPKPTPVPPKPTPVPPKPTPVPPKPTPAPPKPTPAPPKPTPAKSHRELLRERLAAAETKTAPSQPTAPRAPSAPRRSESELADAFTRGLPKTTTAPGVSPAAIDAQKEADELNYAEQVVRPLFYARWQQPSRGELQQSWPTPVEVTFTVLANGRVAGWKLTKRSNSDAMNRSVEALLRQMTQLTPFSQVGIRSASLRIVVNMELGARM